MTKAQHTPGLCKAVKFPCKYPHCKHKGFVEHGFVLASDNKTVVGRFAKYEDAVLDAAAPELLEALEIFVKNYCGNDMWFGIVKARAAIAKAKGDL